MLRDKVLDAMGKLGLHGMKSVFDEVLASGIKQRATPEKMLLDLLGVEIGERTAKSIRYRLGLARFPVDKNLDGFNFSTSPVNETQIRSLHQGSYLQSGNNIILVGGTRHRKDPSCDLHGSPGDQKRQAWSFLQRG